MKTLPSLYKNENIYSKHINKDYFKQVQMIFQNPLNLKRLSAKTLTFITKVTNALRLAYTRPISQKCGCHL